MTGGSARRRSREELGDSYDGTRPFPDDEPAGQTPDDVLVRIHDLAGRPRGTGFVADHRGTVITSHEAVDGLPRLVLHAGDRGRVVAAGEVTPLPALGLALVHTEGLGVGPLPVTARGRIEAGTYVRIAAGCWREARVLDVTDVTYTATDRFHLLGDALALAVGTSGLDALRLGGGAAGGPVLDATTGAVLGVLGTALSSGHRDVGFAVPLRSAPGPLAALLAENAATVPAYGADLNLAGVLELTATALGQDGPPGMRAGRVGAGGPGAVEPVERSAPAREFAAFTARAEGPARVLGLVGAPGSGRTTELAALAARRTRGPERAPTLWLRGADLRGDDTSVADAVRRTLFRAARPVAAAAGRSLPAADPGDVTPERLARLALAAGRPLLLLLDGPEEMPPALAHRLPEWTEGTATWLRETGARMVVACRAEYWEHAGAEFPPDLLHGASTGGLRCVSGVGEPVSAAAVGEPSAGAAVGDRVPGWADGSGRARTADRGTGSASAEGQWSRGAVAGESVSGRGDADGGARVAGRGSGPESVAGESAPGWADAVPRAAAVVGESVPGSARAERRQEAVGGESESGASTGEWLPETAVGRPVCRAADGEPVSSSSVAASTPGAAAGDRTAGSALEEPVPVVAGPPPGATAEGPLPTGALPPCVRLGDLSEDEARQARARYGVPEGALSDADGRHPLTLRLLAEVGAALPGPAAPFRVDRDEVFSAYLDLMCLRVAARLAQENGLHGTAVRRLAAKVSGQVHEAARRSLGRGQGELDREAFEAVFPWGPAPARLGGAAGWASAVLAEGLLVPVGSGYRFAHEELADWIQGIHLDLDEALRVLVHGGGSTTPGAHPLPVPHHRIGSVVEALLLLARQRGTAQLALTLEELVRTLDADPPSWWAARLVAEVLTRVPDATPYAEVLRLLADRIADRRDEGRTAPTEFGPGFWAALRLPQDTLFGLLRRLVLADGPPHEPGPRHLDTVAGLLTADPTAVQPLLARWFEDERPLPATPHATVATAAQALLHTHRHRGLDTLIEVLVDSPHRRADELLGVLAEDEPAAVCRAVDRWAHDERPARRTAAVTQGLRAAPHARTDADRVLLRYAALALLARPSDGALHGGALALLVQDPAARDRHLPRALRHFAAGDPYLPPSAVVTALPTHPEPVLEAFRARLRGADAGEALHRLADATTPELARRVAALVGAAVAERPETAGHVAAYVDRRLDQGTAVRTVLLPLVTGLLADGPEPARAALAGVLATDGTPASRSLRRELREFLLAHEQDPAVLDALLRAAAQAAGGDDLRALVHRTGLLLVRTPYGALRFDRALVDLARHIPGFAARLSGWLADAPQEWAVLVGPSARRTIENLTGVGVPV
ncbi:trypsin-like peptidase domain-containing protein [Streptomyces viridiviolaceus]|uniref:Trypsin-like peptidase domain-containing protein n=1 Tax=Streptomyces viridiviolaceus TaxID=68282 RepID=A0ABW2E5Q2_9ACTN|nr:trypsin-like peptidase domain-containing protein [Streptomyces viridiviolaceus]